MTQLAFDSLLTEGCGKLRFYCGYGFGRVTVPGYTHAIVATPRWCRRALREFDGPIVLDNGAFPAWRDSVELSVEDQISTMSSALNEIGSRLLWAILPDVVSDAAESFRRARIALDRLPIASSSWLLPVQEGASFCDYVSECEIHGLGGVFIGGASKDFKRRASYALAGQVPWVHVARICADHELHWAAHAGADSFDSTTPTRGFTHHQTAGRDRNWAPSFRRYCEPCQ